MLIRQKKGVPKKRQPTWEEWVSPEESVANTGATADHPGLTHEAIANLAYSQSAGNTVTIGAATGTGWNATAKNNGTTTTCGIYVGNAAAPIPANEGEPKCQ